MAETAAAPLVITAEVRGALQDLRTLAARRPVAVVELMHTIKTPEGKRKHMRQMTEQSVVIPGPWPFLVTFSIETGQPVGPCRHMSMSIDRPERVPSPQAVWMVAEELGFVSGIETCSVWDEKLTQGVAINLVQPLWLHPD